MTHCSDDDLVLRYYGDPALSEGARAHLERCTACQDRYRELDQQLQLLPVIDVPARNDHYGLEVWQRIRHRLPERDAAGWFTWRWGQGVAIAALAVVLVIGGFAAGRLWPRAVESDSAAVVSDPAAPDPTRGVLLSAVADHLERSDRVLTDLVNGGGDADISSEQAWAEDLLWAGRLYRQDALDADEHAVAAVLDDLERTLLDVVHGPSQMTNIELEAMRRRVDSAALLFKVRVMRNELNQRRLTGRDEGPSPRIPASHTS